MASMISTFWMGERQVGGDLSSKETAKQVAHAEGYTQRKCLGIENSKTKNSEYM